MATASRHHHPRRADSKLSAHGPPAISGGGNPREWSLLPSSPRIVPMPDAMPARRPCSDPHAKDGLGLVRGRALHRRGACSRTLKPAYLRRCCPRWKPPKLGLPLSLLPGAARRPPPIVADAYRVGGVKRTPPCPAHMPCGMQGQGIQLRTRLHLSDSGTYRPGSYTLSTRH